MKKLLFVFTFCISVIISANAADYLESSGTDRFTGLDYYCALIYGEGSVFLTPVLFLNNTGEQVSLTVEIGLYFDYTNEDVNLYYDVMGNGGAQFYSGAGIGSDYGYSKSSTKTFFVNYDAALEIDYVCDEPGYYDDVFVYAEWE